MYSMYIVNDRLVKGIKSKQDATDILSQMIRIAHDYGAASVADFRDLLSFNSDYWDTKRIWSEHDIRSAEIYPDPNSKYATWVIRLPVPTAITTAEKKTVPHNIHKSDSSPEPLNITIDTNSVDENTLSEVFEYIRSIKDRPVFISIN